MLLQRKPMSLVETRRWCAMAHGSQMYERKGVQGGLQNLRYSFHLKEVEQEAVRFGFGRHQSLRKACLGHDLLEDTNFTALDLLDAGFTALEVAMIDALTDGEGKTRRQRKQRIYQQIPSIPLAVIPKLCDRSRNIKRSIRTRNHRMYDLYAGEHPEFELSLRNPGFELAEPLWKHVSWLLTGHGYDTYTQVPELVDQDLAGWNERSWASRNSHYDRKGS